MSRRRPRPLAALKGAGLSALSALGALALAVVLVWPMWYLATRHTKLYTIFVTAFMLMGLTLSLWRRFRTKRGGMADVSASRLPDASEASVDVISPHSAAPGSAKREETPKTP